jgi:hypothetical protein
MFSQKNFNIYVLMVNIENKVTIAKSRLVLEI